MKEMEELGKRVRKLKEENESKKKSINKLRGEKAFLLEKNTYLMEKLKEASIAYSNAGKRILDLVETQIKPVKKKLDKFDSLYGKISGYEKSVSGGLEKIRSFDNVLNSLKTGVLGLEKRQADVEGVVKSLSRDIIGK